MGTLMGTQMARKAKELSPLEVGRLKEPALYFVGGVAGLILQVKGPDARSWILRAMVGGKRRDIGLGGFPAVTLAGAREAARVARDKINSGTDPVEERIAARSALAASRASAVSFAEAAGRFIEANEAGWKNAKHGAQWKSTLETYAFPTIGRMYVADIETSHVISILEPLWTTKTETANRLRGRIESVLDWAKVRGYRSGENPARWKGHLDHILPARAKVAKVAHHPALDYMRVGSFMTDLKAIDGMGARALQFAILTATRSGEVRGATWAEIDKTTGVWIIPAVRMKLDKEHRVPLSEDALKLLNDLPEIAGTDLVFPSTKSTVLSDMTLTATIRRMDESSTKSGGAGWKENGSGKLITAHGFRSTFRDWAGETTAYPREVIEHALAHQLADKAEAAYARGTQFEKRRRLMSDWAKHCAAPAPAASVTPINQAVA
jgi:integrase